MTQCVKETCLKNVQGSTDGSAKKTQKLDEGMQSAGKTGIRTLLK